MVFVAVTTHQSEPQDVGAAEPTPLQLEREYVVSVSIGSQLGHVIRFRH